MIRLAFALFVVGCASAEVSAPPGDAAPPVSTVPRSIAGTYDLAGTLELQTLPAPAAALLDALSAATDQPDDPARYLVDRMIAALPDGTFKSVAIGLAPYVAPYIQIEIDRIAPHFAPGIRQLATGLSTVAYHMTPIERMIIAPDGLATRALVALQFGSVPCELAGGGAPDALAITRVAIDGEGKLALAGHALQLPYGELLRLGLDRAVIPSIDLSATNLADALSDLVDCRALGATFSEHAGLGSPALYETACIAAMTGLASDTYRKLAAIDDAPFTLNVSGSALGVDLDGDGDMDEIRSGAWTGTATYATTKGPLGAATFAGKRE